MLYTDPSVPRQIEKEARALKYISTADIWFVSHTALSYISTCIMEDVYYVYSARECIVEWELLDRPVEGDHY